MGWSIWYLLAIFAMISRLFQQFLTSQSYYDKHCRVSLLRSQNKCSRRKNISINIKSGGFLFPSLVRRLLTHSCTFGTVISKCSVLLTINNISANFGVHFRLVKNYKIRGISRAHGPSTVSLHFILYAQLCDVRPLTKA